MSDIYDSKKRSEIMRNVKNRNTKPEVLIKSIFCELGYRQYRLKTKHLTCKPDLIFVGKKKAVFVNGCFWHGHTCKKAHLPKTNREFWKEKITKNRKRDKNNYEELENKGWDYLVIWECELKQNGREVLIERIISFMES